MTKTIWDIDLDDLFNKKKPKDERKKIAKTVRDELAYKQNYSCFKCGNRLPPRKHIHHKTPLSKGGKNDPDNLMVVCGSCHDQLHHEMQLQEQATKTTKKEKDIWDLGLDDLF